MEIEEFDSKPSIKSVNYGKREYGYSIPDPRDLDEGRLKLQRRHIRRQLDGLKGELRVADDMRIAIISSSLTGALFALISALFGPVEQQNPFATACLILVIFVFMVSYLGRREERRKHKKVEYLVRFLHDYDDEIEGRGARNTAQPVSTGTLKNQVDRVLGAFWPGRASSPTTGDRADHLPGGPASPER